MTAIQEANEVYKKISMALSVVCLVFSIRSPAQIVAKAEAGQIATGSTNSIERGKFE